MSLKDDIDTMTEYLVRAFHCGMPENEEKVRKMMAIFKEKPFASMAVTSAHLTKQLEKHEEKGTYNSFTFGIQYGMMMALSLQDPEARQKIVMDFIDYQKRESAKYEAARAGTPPPASDKKCPVHGDKRPDDPEVKPELNEPSLLDAMSKAIKEKESSHVTS